MIPLANDEKTKQKGSHFHDLVDQRSQNTTGTPSAKLCSNFIEKLHPGDFPLLITWMKNTQAKTAMNTCGILASARGHEDLAVSLIVTICRDELHPGDFLAHKKFTEIIFSLISLPNVIFKFVEILSNFPSIPKLIIIVATSKEDTKHVDQQCRKNVNIFCLISSSKRMTDFAIMEISSISHSLQILTSPWQSLPLEKKGSSSYSITAAPWDVAFGLCFFLNNNPKHGRLSYW